MSIARRPAKGPKVRRTLISIEKHAIPLPKVRKDLNIYSTRRLPSYQGPLGP